MLPDDSCTLRAGEMWICHPALVPGSRDKIAPLLDFISNSNIITKLPEVPACSWIYLEFQITHCMTQQGRDGRWAWRGHSRPWETVGGGRAPGFGVGLA